jgi:4a-hydroxytetrahydrobiopterin dehydratase
MTELLLHRIVQETVDARHWRVLLQTLRATFRTGSFATGVELVARIGAAADAANHHPDVDLRYGRVDVLLLSHDAGGLTRRDVALAQAITAIADELGVEGEPSEPQALEIAIDALDIPAVLPFWRAVLGYQDSRPDAGPEVVDPAGIGPTVWFQQMDAPRPQRNRIHVDVTVPHDVADARVEAALAAGGRLVSDAEYPAFRILADVEGNEVCVCTWQGRQEE